MLRVRLLLLLLFTTDAKGIIPVYRHSVMVRETLVWCGCQLCCKNNANKPLTEIPTSQYATALKHCRSRGNKAFRTNIFSYRIDLNGRNPGNIPHTAACSAHNIVVKGCMYAAHDTVHEEQAKAAAQAAAEAAAAEAAAAEAAAAEADDAPPYNSPPASPNNSPPASPAKHVSLTHDPAYAFDPQMSENIRLLDPGILACMHLLCMLI